MRLPLGVLMVVLAVAACGGGGSGAGSSASTGSGATGTGGTSGTGGTGSTGASGGSSPPGTPTVVQMNTYQTQNADSENNSTLQFKSLTAAGHTIWVVVTVPDFGGVHTISITDTQGNTYTQLLPQEDDGAPGSQSVAQFYAANIVGDTSVADTITVNWGYDNYKGILITEIAGTTTAPLVGHASAIQDGLAAGTNNVTPGPIAVAAAQTPALLMAVSVNTSGGTSDTGGSNFPGPAAGSGMKQVAMFWDFGQNLGTLATATVTSAESISAVFNAPDTDSFVTVATVFH